MGLSNKDSKELVRLAENIAEWARDNDYPLPDAVYAYLEDGPASNHEWWNASNERKMEVIENIGEDFNVPTGAINRRVAEEYDFWKEEEGIVMEENDSYKVTDVEVPEREINPTYDTDYMYYTMVFTAVRWIIDDMLQNEYTEYFDIEDYYE